MEVRLKEFPEKVLYIDIIVVDVSDVWGMLLSRKFGAMIGGSLEMDLMFLRLPLEGWDNCKITQRTADSDSCSMMLLPAKNEQQKGCDTNSSGLFSKRHALYFTEEEF